MTDIYRDYISISLGEYVGLQNTIESLIGELRRRHLELFEFLRGEQKRFEPDEHDHPGPRARGALITTSSL